MKKILIVFLCFISYNSFSQNFGCTDSLALNYDSLATDDDGSCLYCSSLANFNVDTVSACDSIQISVINIQEATYNWNSSNIYSGQDALIVMVGMDYNNYSFGYSFDRTLSDINTHTVGSHSVMIGYSFGHKKPDEIIEVFIDTDNDGVSDEEDDCPKTPGPADNNGCPVLTVEQEAVVDTAFTNLEFVFSKAEITFDSYKSLTRLGTMLMENPDMRLRIEGHTDNVGGDSMNMTLSKARSTAVKVFLTDRGVDNKSIMTFYYGEQKPIATNDTEEGRAKNRRVELTIYFE